MISRVRPAGPLLAVLAGLTAATPVHAQAQEGAGEASPPAALRDDVRCVIALGAVAASDKDRAKSAMQAALYFIGRIDGAGGSGQLEAWINTEVKLLKNPELPALLTACGERLGERGKSLQEIGGRLKVREAEAPPR